MQNKANQTDQTASNNRGEDIRRDLPEEICSIWLGWRDSNPRMPEPEPGALPLGDTPIVSSMYDYTDSTVFFQRSKWHTYDPHRCNCQ